MKYTIMRIAEGNQNTAPHSSRVAKEITPDIVGFNNVLEHKDKSRMRCVFLHTLLMFGLLQSISTLAMGSAILQGYIDAIDTITEKRLSVAAGGVMAYALAQYWQEHERLRSAHVVHRPYEMIMQCSSLGTGSCLCKAILSLRADEPHE